MIQANKISKTYQMGESQVYALDNVSLEIKKGEFLVIIGPSGSGKSTLLHVLSGLDRPEQGKVVWDKKDLFKLSEKELARFRNQKIGFVFQQFHLLPRATVLENILLPTIYSPDKKKVSGEKVLKSLGLWERRNHTPNQLSGGEQQRVAIARALINSPEVIFADEPTGNLDSKTGIQIMKILKDLNQKEKITLVVVTHDLEIAKLAKKQIKIIDGQIHA